MALFGYMRLVRAGLVHATRRQSRAWLRAREDWGLSLARVHHEGHVSNSFSDWRVYADQREREQIESELGCTAGASAQLVRRRRQHRMRARADGAEELRQRVLAQRTQRSHSSSGGGGDGQCMRTHDAAAATHAGTSASHAAGCDPHARHAPARAAAATVGTALDQPEAADDVATPMTAGRKDDWALFFREQAREAMETQLRCTRGRQLHGRLQNARRKRGEG